MIKKISTHLIAAVAIAIVLFIVSVVIWSFLKDGGTSLQDVLFCVGAIPVIVFSIGVFGQYFGRGDHTYQLSRSASSLSPNQRAELDTTDHKSRFKSGLNWVLAGLMTIAVCYLI